MSVRITIFSACALGLLLACGEGYSNPGDPDNGGNPGASRSVAPDPTGDTFGTTQQPWDLTALTIERDQDGITATLDLSRDVISPIGGDPSALIAFLDLDLDQNPATGTRSSVDEFRADGGSTGLGVDATVNLTDFAADATVAVVDAEGRELGRLRPTFEGHRITLRLAKTVLLNDDGFLDAAAIVGIRARPSDIVPNAGHLTLLR